MDNKQQKFPPFSLSRLLKTVFSPDGGERVCILIDLEDPKEIKDFSFLKDKNLSVQRLAHDVFYKGLKDGVLEELGLTGGEMFAYKITGGSNLDLPDVCFSAEGKPLSLREDIYPNYDIILCVSTFSATAPLTAFAKRYGFRGATLHGLNNIILESGLAVDYNEVSRQAERLRLGMTGAEKVEADFILRGKRYMITIELGGQEAQKSHGLVRGKTPDVANLPAGEIYYIPTGARGRFPLKYEDGTLAVMTVESGAVTGAEFIEGNEEVVTRHLAKIKEDPAVGLIGELGFGTQVLPFSGQDIQDEKILGTFHLATGRSDHLGGDITPDRFRKAENASHDDLLFAPHKTPEILLPQVRMFKDGRSHVLIEDYRPAEYINALLGPEE